MPKKPRVIVFGIDGGSWNLIQPLIDRGLLPALKHLRENGAGAALSSTVPHSSFPAWTTAITGVGPGKHGIVDFTRRLPGQDRLIFLNSRHRGVPTIFETLSRHRSKVASLGIPATSPPDPINGIVIGGFDCPVAVSAQRSMIYPPELARELFRKFGDYPYGSISESRITSQWYATARDVLLKNIAKRQTIFQWLWEKESWDLFWMVFPESDTASHHFWSLHDPDSPRHDPELAAEFGNTLTEIYQRIDQALQGFLDLLNPEDLLIVMSDHGFGGAGTTEIYLNLWLQKQGYLRFLSSRKRKSRSRSITNRALEYLPANVPQWLFRKGKTLMGPLESRRRFNHIDWKHTIAFSEEANSFPAIWCRLKRRDPHGTVSPSGKDSLIEELSEKLLAWRCPITGKPVISKAYRREEIFDGAYVPMIPDLILEPALIDGLSLAIGNSNSAVTDDPVQTIPPNRYRGAKGSGFNGTHRSQGIVVAYQQEKTSGNISHAHIADISPTILRHLNHPVPQWMEGAPIIPEPAPILEAAL